MAKVTNHSVRFLSTIAVATGYLLLITAHVYAQDASEESTVYERAVERAKDRPNHGSAYNSVNERGLIEEYMKKYHGDRDKLSDELSGELKRRRDAKGRSRRNSVDTMLDKLDEMGIPARGFFGRDRDRD